MVCSYSLKGLGFRRFLVCAFGPRMPAVPCGARPHVGRGHAKPPYTMVSEGLEWGVAPKSGEIMAVGIDNGRMESEWLERKRGPAESVWLHEKSHGSAAGRHVHHLPVHRLHVHPQRERRYLDIAHRDFTARSSGHREKATIWPWDDSRSIMRAYVWPVPGLSRTRPRNGSSRTRICSTGCFLTHGRRGSQRRMDRARSRRPASR